jgi:hypothetical protein
MMQWLERFPDEANAVMETVVRIVGSASISASAIAYVVVVLLLM